jgi:hypothetical protein
MTRYEYLTPAGAKGDKRTWPIGTPVSATLTGGSTIKGITSSVPRQVTGGGWVVRVRGCPYVLSLDRVDVRYQLGFVEDVPERASESENEGSARGVGHRGG